MKLKSKFILLKKYQSTFFTRIWKEKRINAWLLEINNDKNINVYLLFFITFIDRYIRGRHITVWLIGIVLYALFWTGAPLLGWSSYGHEPFQTSCTVNWYGKSVADITYNALCIVFCYCVPVAIFIFCYYNVLKKSLQRYVLSTFRNSNNWLL